MKQKLTYFYSLLTAFLWLGSGTMWGETLTVAETPTTTSDCLPLYGYYGDTGGTKSQVIYSKDLLGAMAGGTISAIKFYASTSSASWTGTWAVSLAEVSNTSLSAIITPSSLVEVYKGTLAISSNEMTITFTTPFEYSGENNLLVEISLTKTGNCPEASFRGISSTGAGWCSKKYSAQNVLPKATFTYAAAAVTCDKPTDPTVSGVTSAGATLSWTAGSDETEWNLQYKEAADADWTLVEGITTNSYSLSSSPAKTYQAKVAAVCKDGSGLSKWTSFEQIDIPCGVYPVPTEGWTYGFEGDATGYGKIPACWTAQTYNATYKYPYVNGSSARTGSKCLYFSGGSSSSPQSIILPEFDVDLKDLTLSFYYNNATTDTDYPSLTVGYYDTDGDYTTTFHQIGSALPVKNAYTYAEFDLKDVPTTYKHIVINYAGSGYYSHAAYVDDIKLIRTPNCVRPTEVAGANETATTAEISWTAGGSETKWKLQYTTVTPTSASDGDWTDANSGNDITDNPYTLEGLTPNKTAYYARVKAVCGGSDVSDWSDPSAAFYTECAAKAIPFAENFESTDANDIPSCWDNTNGTNSYTYENTAYVTYAHNGNKCLRMYGGGSSSVQTVLLPELEEDVKNLTISLYYRNGSTGASYGKLQVGYVKEGTFTPLATVDQASSYTLYELDLKDADDAAEYIALRHATGSSNYGTLYIDDITVSLTPTCVKPSALECILTMHTKAKLSWTNGKNETAWKIEYSQNSDFSESTTVSANANPFTLTGLEPSTTYYAHVKADCGGGDESAWCNDAITFTTDCEATTVDATHIFTQNFNALSSGIPSCWKNNKGTTTTASYKWNYYSTGYDGACVRFNSYNNTSGLTNTLETPLIDLDVDATLSFYAKNPTGGAYTLQISVDGADPVTLTTSPATLTGLTSWTEVTADLSAYTNNVVKIFFNGVSNYENGDAYLYLDEVTIAKVSSCAKPTLNDATAQTPEGATFTWTAGGSETQYDYSVVASGETPADWTTISATTVTLTGQAAGTYDFYVRSNCGTDGVSETVKKSFTTATVNSPANLAVANITNEAANVSWDAAAGVSGYEVLCVREDGTKNWDNAAQVATNSVALDTLKASREYTIYVRSYYASATAPATLYGATELSKAFTTKCDPTIVDAANGYTQNFNSLTAAGQIPECWDNSEGTTTDANYKWSYFATGHEGKCVRFDSYNNYSARTNVLASPIFKLKVDADLEFWVKNPTGGAYTVQISVNGGARQDVFTDLTGLTDWTKKEVVLTSYYDAENPKTIQFFFSGTSNNWNNQAYLYLDDFVITPQACRKPASDPVVNSKTGTTASISWGEGGASNYQFAIAPKDETPVWNAANVIAATSKTIEGLTPLTNYDFYVRTYCDEDNQSDARKVSFQTECADYVTLPFNEDFNSLSADAIPACWNNDEGTSEDYYKWKAVTYSGHNTSTCVRFNSSTNDADATNVLATPTIQLGEGNLLTFQAKNPTGGDFKVQIQAEGIAREDLLTSLTGIADWTLKYAAIPAKFDNKKVQLFFCATSNGGDANAYIYIDDVRVARGEAFADGENTGVETRLGGLEGQTLDFVMTRPMQYNGYYNTLCLPFSVSESEMAETEHPFYNCTVKAFDYAVVAGEELQLAITAASGIEAGVPCFLKYDGTATADKTVLLFKEVTISAPAPGSKVDGDVTYAGIFNTITATPESEGAHVPSCLFVGGQNGLYWPTTARKMNAFRAYFSVSTGNNAPIRRGMSARIVERAEVATGCENVNAAEKAVKLLENGQVIIIRNGVKYNIQGQIISK